VRWRAPAGRASAPSSKGDRPPLRRASAPTVSSTSHPSTPSAHGPCPDHRFEYPRLHSSRMKRSASSPPRNEPPTVRRLSTTRRIAAPDRFDDGLDAGERGLRRASIDRGCTRDKTFTGIRRRSAQVPEAGVGCGPDQPARNQHGWRGRLQVPRPLSPVSGSATSPGGFAISGARPGLAGTRDEIHGEIPVNPQHVVSRLNAHLRSRRRL
jgi:hypothetical protein